jgi:hypothetical protein
MAGYNEILVGRFNRGLQKLFGIKGGPPVPTLGSEIMPIHPLASGVETRYLEGWNRYSSFFVLAAAVGFNSDVRIRNPRANNVLAVLEKLAVASAAVQSIAVSLGTQVVDFPAGIISPAARLDGRIGTQSSSLILSQQNTAVTVASNQVAVAVINSVTQAPLDLIQYENQELTLLPGDGLELHTVVNSSLIVSFIVRERFLEDSERT